MEKMPNKYLTVSEFAEEIPCTVSCARRWIREGRIASVKISPPLLRIPRLELERLFVEGLRPAKKSKEGGPR